MDNVALTTRGANELTTIMEQAGQAANEAAARSAFADYRSRKAANTIRRQENTLALFAHFLEETTGTQAGDLAGGPGAWHGVTWGLVEGFARWLLLGGYAVGSVNGHLSTVKTYAKLAARSGALSAQDVAMIRTVAGYRKKEGKQVDEKRTAASIPTRGGRKGRAKKNEPVSLTPAQAQALKEQPNTSQGRRDRLLLCLLADHGLRVGEVAGLAVTDVDLKRGELRFYRPKVDKTQTHKLTADAWEAARVYLDNDGLSIGPLLRASRKGGRLADPGMTTRAITARVGELGARVGVAGLSAHDLRHYWATQAARSGTPIDRLQDAGGWSSPAMPLQYIEAAAIANEGVKLEVAE